MKIKNKEMLYKSIQTIRTTIEDSCIIWLLLWKGSQRPWKATVAFHQILWCWLGPLICSDFVTLELLKDLDCEWVNWRFDLKMDFAVALVQDLEATTRMRFSQWQGVNHKLYAMHRIKIETYPKSEVQFSEGWRWVGLLQFCTAHNFFVLKSLIFGLKFMRNNK
jgi:hypothetical protein